MTNIIIPHSFNGKQVFQLAEDTIIAGTLIPKGFVNATQICQANGKRWAKYMEFSKTPLFLDALKEVSPSKGLTHVIIITEGLNDYRGTWVSLPVAMNLAQWCSPDFAAWASIVLSAVLQGDFKPLTEEAATAQAKLQEQWQVLRKAGKVTRLKLTDAIKLWYERNPGGTSRPQHAMYAQTTDNIYKALWGMNAKQLEEHLGCGRHESRDAMDAASLAALEMNEHRVSQFIEDDNLKPVDAVAVANLRREKHLPSPKF